MAWNGYYMYGGNEILNVTRTETYAKWAQLNWFKPIYGNDSLPAVLGDRTYVSPAQDNAPWTDPDVPASYGFYGAYPLDINGIEDSTRTSVVVESLADGGNPGRLRNGTKTVVFSAALIGEDEAAVAYGFTWLKQSLLSGPCGGVGCDGSDLCYLVSEPLVDLNADTDVTVITVVPPADTDGGTPTLHGSDLDGGDVVTYDGGGTGGGGSDADGGTSGSSGSDVDGGSFDELPDYDGGTPDLGHDETIIVPDITNATDCLPPLLRSLRKVVFNSGPTVTAQRNTSDGGAVWTVTFTAVAGAPWEYGDEVPVIEGFLDPDVMVPWAGGVIPDGGYTDLDGHFYSEAACAQPVFSPLQDPLLVTVIPPPLPPSIPLGNFSPPAHWRRRQITIPRQYIPLWGEVVPKFQVHARTADLRNLRLRFYADVDGDGDISDDPCAFCGDLVVSYVPMGSTLVFDAVEQQVYVIDSSQNRRVANQLVFSTDGTPFDWPVLSCGMGYVVTLDLPQTQAAPVFDLSLFSRAA